MFEWSKGILMHLGDLLGHPKSISGHWGGILRAFWGDLALNHRACVQK